MPTRSRRGRIDGLCACADSYDKTGQGNLGLHPSPTHHFGRATSGCNPRDVPTKKSGLFAGHTISILARYDFFRQLARFVHSRNPAIGARGRCMSATSCSDGALDLRRCSSKWDQVHERSLRSASRELPVYYRELMAAFGCDLPVISYS